MRFKIQQNDWGLQHYPSAGVHLSLLDNVSYAFSCQTKRKSIYILFESIIFNLYCSNLVLLPGYGQHRSLTVRYWLLHFIVDHILYLQAGSRVWRRIFRRLGRSSFIRSSSKLMSSSTLSGSYLAQSSKACIYEFMITAFLCEYFPYALALWFQESFGASVHLIRLSSSPNLWTASGLELVERRKTFSSFVAISVLQSLQF